MQSPQTHYIKSCAFSWLIQLCAGQITRTEAAIHATRDSFHSAQCEAVLLIDANAFNSLNREVALRNIQSLCPSFATILINTYHTATELFVQDTTIFSRKGPTQRDPLAMPMYALGILPLIHRSTGDILQEWYADDASATGTIMQPKIMVGKNHLPMVTMLMPQKTWLVVKDTHLASATSGFQGTNVNITSEGRPHLGAPLGTAAICDAIYEGCKVVPSTADLMQNCQHSTTCDLRRFHSQCGSPMDLPCQNHS